MLCSICKKNIAIVFITKIIDGKQTQDGLCLTCAKSQGIQPVNQLLDQVGLTEEDLDNLNNQVGDIVGNMDILNNDKLDNDNNSSKNLFSFLGNLFPKDTDAFVGNPESASPSSNHPDKDKTTRVKTQEKKVPKKKKYLDVYGINLIEEAKEDKIDKIIGREKKSGQ